MYYKSEEALSRAKTIDETAYTFNDEGELPRRMIMAGNIISLLAEGNLIEMPSLPLFSGAVKQA